MGENDDKRPMNETLFVLSGSDRHVAEEMRISRNTVRKYLRRIDDVLEGD